MKKISKKEIYKLMREDHTRFYKPIPEAWKEVFPVITLEILKECGLKTTTNHTGKMSGMASLSTTCKCNESCQNKILAAYKTLGIDITDKKTAKQALKNYLSENPYATNISICAFCFSDSQQDIFTSMVDPLTHNFQILNNGIIHEDWIPVLNTLFFRGEAFGDFASLYSVINFYNLARKNPLVSVTAWTKNLIWFHQAKKAGITKPDNFKLVYSSHFINKPSPIPVDCANIVDHRFTVYTKEYSEKYQININCGARSCLACLRCYRGNSFEISELLK